jgi:hypothetical protein
MKGWTGGSLELKKFKTNNLVDVLVTNVAGTICACEALERFLKNRGRTLT